MADGEFGRGKRVRLIGRHPWAGQWGWIVERLGSYAADRRWVVELPDQGGHQVGASEREMERFGEHADACTAE